MTHKENGYEVKCLRSGQVRRYGPTVNEYIVRDMTGERTEEEIRKYCTEHVRKADDPRKHGLITHLQTFKLLGDGSYRYICGHEYTG
jgi:hypothetical protein